MEEPTRKSHARVYDAAGTLVPSPGELIFAELKKQGFSQKELAVRLDRSEKFVSQLITGKVRLTYDVCYDLERILHVPAKTWNDTEARYQEVLTVQKHYDAISKDEKTLAWAATFPYDKMVELELVAPSLDDAVRALNILEYFQVCSYKAYQAALVSDKTSPIFFEKVNAINKLA